jgi:hypothetical protein|eukprot:2290383-Prymnesium_polylepis.2
MLSTVSSGECVDGRCTITRIVEVVHQGRKSLIANHLNHIRRLNGVHIGARSLAKVSRVLCAAKSSVDVKACLAHPATLQHDDCVRDTSRVQHGGQARAIAVPTVDACHLSTVEVRQHRLQHGVEDTMREWLSTQI